MVKVYYLKALDELVAKHPMVNLSLYVDDFLCDTTGPPNAVVHSLADFIGELDDAVQQELKAKLASSKA